MSQPELRVLGVMTGTSCDGLDAACLSFSSSSWRTLWTRSIPYSSSLRNRVFAYQEPKSKHSTVDLLSLNRDLGAWYGKVLKEMIQEFDPDSRPHVIANHGQTVAHFPKAHVTFQMGDATLISTQTATTSISQFRNGDMAVGGQGAPLVPVFHRLLARQFAGSGEGVVIQNMGGIGNLTYVGPGGSLISFDTGPGNVWIDAAVSKITRGKFKMDTDGKIAAQAAPNPAVIKKLLSHKFFKLAPPKSTGRDEINPTYFFSKAGKLKGAAMVSTATAATVETLAMAYENYILSKGVPIYKIFLVGGGAKNPAIIHGLQARMGNIPVASLAQQEINPQFVEAQAFALYGLMCLFGKPIGGPWTGAQGFGPPGLICPGSNWNEVLERVTALKTSGVRYL
ncbi:anhydro-N-acetylmuramic acid kinase [bacterium]|nr:anhydro-N-acetylmuramic acid kinase [bacterium]